jgi:hypothetical protein
VRAWEPVVGISRPEGSSQRGYRSLRARCDALDTDPALTGRGYCISPLRSWAVTCCFVAVSTKGVREIGNRQTMILNESGGEGGASSPELDNILVRVIQSKHQQHVIFHMARQQKVLLYMLVAVFA